jgi:ABC-2 type transport system permease protein
VSELRWLPAVLSLELRKALSYRADFWVSFLGSVLVEVSIAYYLWSAIFAFRGSGYLSGYTFGEMMLYYLFVPCLGRVMRGGSELGNLSQDIYDGSLSRYLVYPVSFLPYKYAACLAQALISCVQTLLTLLVFLLAFGVPEDCGISLLSVVSGLVAAVFCSYLYFAIASLLELSAFWAENVWSLLVILRLASSLLGGGMVPLELFPDWGRSIVALTPFPYMFSFCIRAAMADLKPGEWGSGMLMILLWSSVFTAACLAVWKKGTRQYAGAGM